VEHCPVQGKCQWSGVVYEARVATPDVVRPMEYKGAAATTFKVRYGNHKTVMNNSGSNQKTALSTYVWAKKREGMSPNITFRILKRAMPYTIESGKCRLCNEERLQIALADKEVSLNR
jgi:hypothetical protein